MEICEAEGVGVAYCVSWLGYGLDGPAFESH
jgi:hypothetical protein